MRRLHRLAAFTLLSAVLPGCAHPVATVEIGAPTAVTRVLVASEPSEFKATVIQKLAEQLEPEGFFIKVIDLSIFVEEPLVEYDAIVLLNALEMGQLDGDVEDAIERADETVWEKMILVTTTSHEDWSYFHEEPERLGVDALTAASSDGNIDTLVSKLVTSVRATLGS